MQVKALGTNDLGTLIVPWYHSFQTVPETFILSFVHPCFPQGTACQKKAALTGDALSNPPHWENNEDSEEYLPLAIPSASKKNLFL